MGRDLYALSLLLRVDDQRGILSQSHRDLVWQYLARMTQCVFNTPLAAGHGYTVLSGQEVQAVIANLEWWPFHHQAFALLMPFTNERRDCLRRRPGQTTLADSADAPIMVRPISRNALASGSNRGLTPSGCLVLV